MKISSEKNQQHSFEYYLLEGQRYNLLEKRRYRNLLHLLKHNMLSPECKQELQAMVDKAQQELALSCFPYPPPTLEQIPHGPTPFGRVVMPSGLGEVAELPDRPVNSLLAGKQNTGKTYLATLLSIGSTPATRIIVIDNRSDLEFLFRYIPKALYLNAETASLNPFEPDPGIPFETNLRHTLNILGESLTLLHRIMNVLHEAALGVKNDNKAVTPGNLLRFLRSNKKRFSHNWEAYNSALDRLEGLSRDFRGWNLERRLTTVDLLKYRLLYINTSHIGRTDHRIAFVTLFLGRLWLWQREYSPRSNQTEVLTVIDEAEVYLSANRLKGQYASTFSQDLLRQGRAVGMQFVLVVHQVSDLDSTVLANAGNLFTFRITSADDQRRIGNSLGLPHEAHQLLGKLEDRHCVVRLDTGYPHPFRVRVLDVEINNTPLSTAERQAVLERQAPLVPMPQEEPQGAIEVEEEITPTPVHAPRRIHQRELDHATQNLLFAINNHGLKGVTEVYRAAGVNANTGKKRLQELINQDLVGTHRLDLPGRGGQRVTVFLKDRGAELIGAEPSRGRGGDDHRAYQKEFAYALKEHGFEAEIEKTIDGKAVDVVVRRTGKDGCVRLDAIEIDVTTDPIENTRKDLDRGFSEVFLTFPLERSARLLARIKDEFTEEERQRIQVIEPKRFLPEYVRIVERKS